MMGPQVFTLPPLIIIPGTEMTWVQFEHHCVLASLRNQPEPKSRDQAELLSNKMLAAQLKDRIFQILCSPQLLNQPANLSAVAGALCRRKLLLWRTFPFNDLPVEIVINIFRYAVWSTHGSPESILSRFHLTWVCRRWRNIAALDQTLWNTILFSDFKIGYARSILFLQRAGTATLDLRIEDDEKTRVTPAQQQQCQQQQQQAHTQQQQQQQQLQPMTADDMHRLMDILTTKSSQIRMFIAVVEMWPPILVLLDRLHKSSRSLQQLERIEIHRTGRPYRWDGPDYPLSDYQHALALCDGRTRRVNFICLNGIHLDWEKCPLANLTTLDLRRMPPHLGPSLERFREMLKSSPNLRKLCLDGAGPVEPPGRAANSYAPVFLPRLESFILGDVLAEYAAFCAGIIHAPNVREMTLLNLVGEDHTPFIKALTGKFPELLMVTLYTLVVPKSPQSAKVVAEWLLSIPKVRFMRMASMEPHLFANFFVDGRLHLRDDIPLIVTLEESEAILGNGPIILCPQLEAIEVQRINHDSVINFVFGRAKDGVPLRSLYVHKDWAERLNPHGKAALQRFGPDLLHVTRPSTLTPLENEIWKQFGGRP